MARCKTRKERKRLILISFVIVGLVAILFLNVYNNFVKIVNNKTEKEQLLAKYNDLLEEETNLESSVAKMQDPDYIARYAKEKYLYSSQDEIIIRIDE